MNPVDNFRHRLSPELLIKWNDMFDKVTSLQKAYAPDKVY